MLQYYLYYHRTHYLQELVVTSFVGVAPPNAVPKNVIVSPTAYPAPALVTLAP